MKEEDFEEHEAIITSRTDVINKQNATDIWSRVVQKAIDDLALFLRMKQDNEKMSEEDISNATSAYGFLFSDDYTIPFDDYYIDIYCPGCDDIWMDKMSDAATTANITCPLCGYKTSWSSLEYQISKEQNLCEISLPELLTYWGQNDIEGFRRGARERICQLAKDRRKALETRRANMRKNATRQRNMGKRAGK